MGWHLRTGQYIWEQRSIPRQDIYSFTFQGMPWLTHEWLTELVLYPIYQAAGFTGLSLAFATVITAAYAILFFILRLRGVGPVLSAILVALAALTSAPIWGARPLMFSILFAAIYLLILELHRMGRRRYILILPPLMILWVNLHGAYILGLAILTIYILGPLIEGLVRWQGHRVPVYSLIVIAALCLAATLINPNTYRILAYPFQIVTSQAMRAYVSEWPSPDFHRPQYLPLAISFLLLLSSLGLSRPVTLRRQATDLLLILFFGFLALQSRRHIPFFALAATPILGQLLESLRQDFTSTPLYLRLKGLMGQVNREVSTTALTQAVNWLMVGTILASVLWGLSSAVSSEANGVAQRRYFPADAVDYIEREGIKGRLYNSYNWGGYLILRLYPSQKVFIDSRADVYGDAFINEYVEAYFVRPGWRQVLDNYKIEYVLIEEGSPLANLLTASGDWLTLYSDPVAALFARRKA